MLLCVFILNLLIVGVVAPPPSSTPSTPAPTPVNCIYNYNTCGACSATCGGGEKTCYLQITTYSSNGGAACPTATTRTESCNTNACPPVNCAYNYDTCGACSASCGGGTKACSLAITTQAANGGTACPTASSKQVACNTQACAPVNCAYNYDTCGACSASCGGGTKACSLAITTQAANGGTACPTASSKQVACNTQACAPVNCAYNYDTCGACSASCGGGIKACSLAITTQAANGGTACPTASSNQVACNTQACAPSPTPSSVPTSTANANITVDATLTLAPSVMAADEDTATFKSKIIPTIAKAAGVEQTAVVVESVVRTTSSSSTTTTPRRRRSRGLLSADLGAVVVDVTVVYKVDGTAATRESQTDKAVAFVSKAQYMTSSLLPETMANSANVCVTSLEATAASGVSCPPPKSSADAGASIDRKEYGAARRALNDIVLCSHKNGGMGLEDATMADVYNLLGFANRKLQSPDTVLSELFYLRALSINPRHVDARGYLGELYVQINEPAKARKTLDDLKLMCPPPKGCKSLDYLREAMHKVGNNFTEGAYVRELQWSDCFDEKCSPINITAGDTVLFKYGTSHDVVELPGAAEYNACGSLNVNVVGMTTDGAAGYKRKFVEVGTHYFACGQGQHCTAGQKAIVHVHEARKMPSTGGTAPSYSKKAPAPAPAPAPARSQQGFVDESPSSGASGRHSFATVVASVLAMAMTLFAA